MQLLREVPDLPSDYVGVDNLASGRLLGTHLREAGVSRAVLVGGDSPSAQFRERHEGLAETLGHEVRTIMGGASEVAHEIGRTRPDCVVTYNDTHLLSVLHVLRDHGLVPGRDVALASFDNTSLSAEVSPGVTSVDHHAALLATRAVELLRLRSQNPDRDWECVMIEGDLVVRGSTRLG